MQTLKSIDVASAEGKTKQIFEALHKRLGTVPNLARVIANSPAALNAYASFDGALAQGTLPASLRQQISIAVANADSCQYCLSAHTLPGRLRGLSEAELASAQKAESQDPTAAAALLFTKKVVSERGQVSAADVKELLAAGYTEGDAVEIVAAVAINIFTNYLNNVAGTEIDFPVAERIA